MALVSQVSANAVGSLFHYVYASIKVCELPSPIHPCPTPLLSNMMVLCTRPYESQVLFLLLAFSCLPFTKVPRFHSAPAGPPVIPRPPSGQPSLQLTTHHVQSIKLISPVVRAGPILGSAKGPSCTEAIKKGQKRRRIFFLRAS